MWTDEVTGIGHEVPFTIWPGRTRRTRAFIAVASLLAATALVFVGGSTGAAEPVCEGGTMHANLKPAGFPGPEFQELSAGGVTVTLQRSIEPSRPYETVLDIDDGGQTVRVWVFWGLNDIEDVIVLGIIPEPDPGNIHIEVTSTPWPGPENTAGWIQHVDICVLPTEAPPDPESGVCVWDADGEEWLLDTAQEGEQTQDDCDQLAGPEAEDDTTPDTTSDTTSESAPASLPDTGAGGLSALLVGGLGVLLLGSGALTVASRRRRDSAEGIHARGGA